MSLLSLFSTFTTLRTLLHVSTKNRNRRFTQVFRRKCMLCTIDHPLIHFFCLVRALAGLPKCSVLVYVEAEATGFGTTDCDFDPDALVGARLLTFRFRKAATLPWQESIRKNMKAIELPKICAARQNKAVPKMLFWARCVIAKTWPAAKPYITPLFFNSSKIKNRNHN